MNSLLYNIHIVKKKIIFSMAGLFILFILLSTVFFPETLTTLKNSTLELATVILSHNFRSTVDMTSRYNNAPRTGKVRILIVPGHEPNYGGAEYGALKERTMTAELGQDLQRLLERNPHYEVFTTRTAQAWTPDFATYFQEHWQEINEWRKASKEDFSQVLAISSTSQPYAAIQHNDAREDVAIRLYGITKWANEHAIDIIIHLHINDNPRKNVRVPGKHRGFAVYVPAGQYGNSASTKVIANSIVQRLAQHYPVSSLLGEDTGIIDEPELVAIGAHNTSDAASMLIEYGYIYEPQFQQKAVRSAALQNLANYTYRGLQDFFEPGGSE
jgi:N-acetylmuramoyl-L-alanine amidase